MGQTNVQKYLRPLLQLIQEDGFARPSRGRGRNHGVYGFRISGVDVVARDLDVLLPTELAQLKLDRPSGISREHFGPGEDIFCQGDLGDRIYIIESGKVEVLRNDGGEISRLAELGEGEFFGEMALMHNTVRTATVRCREALNVVSLPKREFLMITSHLPHARERLESISDQRARANNARVAATA